MCSITSILCIGQYPGEHGVIAPGMNCSFLVRFAPDSLTDFVDKIQVCMCIRFFHLQHAQLLHQKNLFNL